MKYTLVCVPLGSEFAIAALAAGSKPGAGAKFTTSLFSASSPVRANGVGWSGLMNSGDGMRVVKWTQQQERTSDLAVWGQARLT